MTKEELIAAIREHSRQCSIRTHESGLRATVKLRNILFTSNVFGARIGPTFSIGTPLPTMLAELLDNKEITPEEYLDLLMIKDANGVTYLASLLDHKCPHDVTLQCIANLARCTGQNRASSVKVIRLLQKLPNAHNRFCFYTIQESTQYKTFVTALRKDPHLSLRERTVGSQLLQWKFVENDIDDIIAFVKSDSTPANEISGLLEEDLVCTRLFSSNSAAIHEKGLTLIRELLKSNKVTKSSLIAFLFNHHSKDNADYWGMSYLHGVATTANTFELLHELLQIQPLAKEAAEHFLKFTVNGALPRVLVAHGSIAFHREYLAGILAAIAVNPANIEKFLIGLNTEIAVWKKDVIVSGNYFTQVLNAIDSNYVRRHEIMIIFIDFLMQIQKDYHMALPSIKALLSSDACRQFNFAKSGRVLAKLLELVEVMNQDTSITGLEILDTVQHVMGNNKDALQKAMHGNSTSATTFADPINSDVSRLVVLINNIITNWSWHGNNLKDTQLLGAYSELGFASATAQLKQLNAKQVSARPQLSKAYKGD